MTEVKETKSKGTKKEMAFETDFKAWVRDNAKPVEFKKDGVTTDGLQINQTEMVKLWKKEGVDVDTVLRANTIVSKVNTEGIDYASEILEENLLKKSAELKKNGVSDEERLEALGGAKTHIKTVAPGVRYKHTIVTRKVGRNPSTGDDIIRFGSISGTTKHSQTYDKEAIVSMQDRIEKIYKSL